MKELRYTLLTDGSSDRALLRILTWVLREHLPSRAIGEAWADLGRLRRTWPSTGLVERIDTAVHHYPCDLLFIHRDAETAGRQERVQEIREAQARSAHPNLPAICVVPVRMTEAWLLFDDRAIRRAAGNPKGQSPLPIPDGSAEAIPKPKAVLHQALTAASNLSGRRRKRFRPEERAYLVAQYIGDFTPLRGLPAFCAMEQELKELIDQSSW